MPPPGRIDQVYQLSLMELTFIVIFLILLLTGWMIVKTEDDKATALRERDEARASLAELAGGGDALARLESLNQSVRQGKAEILAALEGRGVENPEAMLSELLEKAEVENQNRQFKQRVEDLDAQLSAMEEIRKIVEAAMPNSASDGVGQRSAAALEAAKAEVRSALEFKRAVEQASGEPVPRGAERETAQNYAQALRELSALGAEGRDGQVLARENQDLRGQVAWMRQRLDARGGRDYPPCWAEADTGKPQYLLTLTLLENGLRSEPAWPPERGADAERLPGIGGLTGAGILSLGAFQSRARPLDADSRNQGCRHYVRLINRVKNLDTFNRYRYAVEEFFYKFELR